MEIFNINEDGLDNYYISKDGRVFKEIKGREVSGGYLSVHLFNGKDFKIHRLVAKTFIPNPNNLPQVNHIDGNKKNNSVDNLEWVSRSGNVRHAYDTGLINSTNISRGLKKFHSKVERGEI